MLEVTTVESKKNHFPTLSIPKINSDHLRHLWQLRNQGKVSESFEAFMRIEFPLDKALESSQKLKQLQNLGLTFEDAISYLLLEVSFLRNQLRLTEANQLLADLERETLVRNHPTHFGLISQKALNAFAANDFLLSFDLFVKARQLTKTSDEQAWVLHNQILTMEELGMDAKASIDAFHSLIPELPSDWREHFEGKAHAISIRQAYRSGQLIELMGGLNAKSLDDYSRYFLSWTTALPYIDCQVEKNYLGNLIDTYTKNGSQWLSGYRLRTQQGLLIEMDLDPDLPIRECVERFYLWTWRWLVNPNIDNLSRALSVRKKIIPRGRHILSPEHHQMLKNASRWLGIFAFFPESEIEKSIGGYRSPCSQGSVFLEYETVLQSYLLNLRRADTIVAQDTYDYLVRTPAHAIKGFLLPPLLLSLSKGNPTPPVMSELSQSLSKLFFVNSRKMDSGFIVCGTERKIRRIANGRCISEHSHGGLVSLCLLIQERPAFTKCEVLRYCFGINRYDAYIHDSKIANLLSLANKTLRGVVHFSCRNDLISSKVLVPGKFRVEGDCSHARCLGHASKDLNDLLSTTTSEERNTRTTHQKDLEYLSREWVPRSKFEELLGVSKATTTRRLKEWSKQNLVQCRGKGKSSRYRLKPALIERFEREGYINA